MESCSRSDAFEQKKLKELRNKFKRILKTDKEFVKNEVSKKKDGLTPLIRACRLGQLKVVQYLVTFCGADVNQVADQSASYHDMQGLSPLLCAVLDGHRSIVKFLISAGADVNSTTHPEWTPLRALTWDILPLQKSYW
jgi:ankyrin repeat protein